MSRQKKRKQKRKEEKQQRTQQRLDQSLRDRQKKSEREKIRKQERAAEIQRRFPESPFFRVRKYILLGLVGTGLLGFYVFDNDTVAKGAAIAFFLILFVPRRRNPRIKAKHRAQDDKFWDDVFRSNDDERLFS